MIPTWLLSFLGKTNTEEFSYTGKYKVFIKGTLINGEWVVDVRVEALPYFAWGCNKYNTRLRGSFKSVIRQHLALVLNQLTEYGAVGKQEILSVIKGHLE